VYVRPESSPSWLAQRLPITVNNGLPASNPDWVYTCWQPGSQMNMTGSGLLVAGVGTMIVAIPIIVGVNVLLSASPQRDGVDSSGRGGIPTTPRPIW